MSDHSPTNAPSVQWSLAQDLEFITSSVGPYWNELKGARLFITGGTGFIGCWLLEALRHANRKLDLGLQATILTRNPSAFQNKAPHLASYGSFRFIAGNIADFASPGGEFSHLIHAATDASADLNERNPRQMFDTVLLGTRRALDFGVEKSVKRCLFLSSGAVYGQQPWELEQVPETWTGAPDCLNPKNTYAEAKRAAEMLCSIYYKQFGLEVSIARIFALLGPYLALDIHFAAGNFILDALRGRPVIVQGNGRPCRSYLYASDLTAWLLHMLVRGQPGKAYNVGSNETVSIAELAERTARLIGNGEFQVLNAGDAGWNPGRYVPNTDLVGHELGLYKTVSLDQAIMRTALWQGWNKQGD